MYHSAKEFFDFLIRERKKVAFLGTGVTNHDCIRMFAEKGIDVTLCDRRSAQQLGADYEEFTALGVHMRLGEGYLSNLKADILMRSPGMRFHLPELDEARRRGIAVTSEMELFFALCPCKIIAVTGSDGKTTTTSLIAEMLRAEGKTVHLGGNIGRALLPSIETISPEDFAVVELSSFQLISMRQSPDIAVVTNVAPNHLDMHKDMQEYIDAKRNILLHQDAFSRSVLNLDNEITRAMQKDCRGAVSFFSRKSPVEDGAYLTGEGEILLACGGSATRVIHRDDIRIPGIHNVENYLAAISALRGLVSFETIRRVAREFPGVEHRIELVRETGGVKWYNDSIASSPTRTIAGLNSFEQKVILIAGGYDKKIPYAPLAPLLAQKVKTLILMGATGPKIEAALRECPQYQDGAPVILHADSMEQAVNMARQQAQRGDIVTLSPASASFDLYRNFEERGRHFKSLVNALRD